MKTMWLSFTDPDRPKGQQFLGVAVIDVPDDFVPIAKERMLAHYPHAEPGAEWVYAATMLAWHHQCNPGGEVALVDVTDDPEIAGVPRNRLLTREELEADELI
jgi:hypothetical protein